MTLSFSLATGGDLYSSWKWIEALTFSEGLDWAWQSLMLLGGVLALLSVPSVLLTRRGTPLSALSWLAVLFILPWIGALLWWLIGRKGLRRRRKKRRRARAAEFARLRLEESQHSQPPSSTTNLNPDLHQSIDSVYQVSSHRSPDTITLLLEPAPAFEYMESKLKRAQSCIHLVYYIWKNDETGRRWAEILCERAKAGVQVRVLLDHLGSLEAGPDFWRELIVAGGEVSYFMPLRLLTLKRRSLNFRNHRKIAVIDHHIAFTGGMNICNNHRLHWLDTHFEMQGPSVAALEDVMLDDWYFATGKYIAPEAAPTATAADISNQPSIPNFPQAISERARVLSSGPDSPQPWIHDEQFRLMASAKDRLWIATPYFIPSESITTALRTAATRGLDVRIMVPARSDHAFVRWASRAYYADLLAVGVRIYEYLPRMMHAKMMICDQDWCMIGSANLDPRSYRLNFEVACAFESTQMVAHLERWFLEHFADCHRITAKSFQSLPKWQQMRDSIAHLMSPLL